MKEKKREDQESEQWARRSVTNVPLHFVLVNAFSNNLSTVRIQRLQKKSISVIQKKSVVNDNDDNEKKRQTGAFNLIIIFGWWFYRSVFVNKKKCTIKKSI